MKLAIAALPALVLSAAIALPAIAKPGHGSLDARLEAVDTDKDGQITRDEIDAMAKKNFAEADTNGDGFLSEEEISEHRQMKREARKAERYARMDTDKDGKLSEAEFAVRGQTMFERLDSDGDGVATNAEIEAFKAKMPKRFGGGSGRP